MRTPSPVRRAASLGERLLLTMFGLAFCAFAAFALWTMGRSSLVARTVRDTWVRTPCVVLASEVRDVAGGYALSVRYRYEAEGRERESSAFSPGTAEHRFDSVSERAGLLETYRPGASATCLVNPADPGEAVLAAADGDAPPWFAFLFPLVFLVAGLSVAVSAWRRPAARRTASSGTPDGPSADPPGSPWLAKALPIVFCSVFIAVGCGVMSFAFRQRARMAASRDWPLAEGAVERVEVRRQWRSGSKGRGGHWTYEPYAAYAYEVDGRRFVNDRRGFATSSSSRSDAARRFVEEHPVGTRVAVRFNPADPADSVLDDAGGQDGFASWFPVAFGAVFALFGAGFLVMMLRSGSRGTGVRAACSPGRAGTVGMRQPARGTGALVRAGRGAEFVQMLVFSVLWCSVTALVGTGFLHEMDWPPQGEEWIPVAFIAVFACIGVGLLVRTLVAGARLGGPHLEITCGSGFVAPGAETLFSYRLVGRVEDVDSLIVWLVGERQTWERHRRQRRCETREFHRAEVLRATTPHEIGQGFFRVALPADAAPSGRDGAGGSVEWKLAVSGHCRNRPGFRDIYPLGTGSTMW